MNCELSSDGFIFLHLLLFLNFNSHTYLMKKDFFIALPLIGATLLMASCGDTTTTTSTTDTMVVAPVAAITLTDVPASPEFPTAQLSMAGVKSEVKEGSDSVKLSFTFNVKNYELTNQTDDAGGKMCANSDKGQHIHFILDNAPYAALYEPKHEVTVALNSEHTLVCFLSRSYHQSIKEKGAALQYRFKIDGKGKLEKMPELTTPMLTYSRPKGDYVGKDMENVLLDFYVMNATLGSDYMVKADVKNETTGASASFDVKDWKSNFIKGLGEGKSTVTLTLIDKDGKQVGDNKITRNIRLSSAEPMP